MNRWSSKFRYSPSQSSRFRSLQLYVYVIIHASDFVIARAKTFQSKLRHGQDTKNFSMETILDLLTVLLSEVIVTILFLDPVLEMNSISETSILYIDIREDHVQDLILHHKDLFLVFIEIPLKSLTYKMKTFQSQTTNLNQYKNHCNDKVVTIKSGFKTFLVNLTKKLIRI